MSFLKPLPVWAVLVTILAACSLGGSAASVTAPPTAELTVTARNGEFEERELVVPADSSFHLFFRNLDLAPHNVAIYTDSSATDALFVGDTISDAATVYDVPALAPGTYFLRCDVHPDMTGSVVARPA